MVIVTTARLEQEQYAAVLPENTPPPYLLLDINSNAEKAGIPVTYTLTEDIATGKIANNLCYLHTHRDIVTGKAVNIPVTYTLTEDIATGKIAKNPDFTYTFNDDIAKGKHR